MLAEHLNVFNAKAHVMNDTSDFNFTGLLALSSPDLWLKDGDFSQWTSEESPAFDTFMMGQSTLNTWYGVFVNNAAAQDWTVKNMPQDGLVNL